MENIRNIKELFKPNFIRIYAILVGKPSIIAEKIIKNQCSWKEAVGVYISLYILSILIYQLVLKVHTTKSMDVLGLTIFQLIYIFIAAAIIQVAWSIVGGRASYVSTFKFSLYTFGILYVMNSLLFPFDIYSDAGGNKLIVILAALVVIIWTWKVWSAYGTLNKSTLLWKRFITFLVAGVLFIISGYILQVLIKYFVTIT